MPAVNSDTRSPTIEQTPEMILNSSTTSSSFFSNYNIHTKYYLCLSLFWINTMIANRYPVHNPTAKNGYIRRDYECVRLEMLSLLADINLLTGEAVPLDNQTYTSWLNRIGSFSSKMTK